MGLALIEFDQIAANDARIGIVEISRAGETDVHHFRSDCFLSINGAAYFATREGVDVGPFVNKASAQKGHQRFIEAIQKDVPFKRAILLATGSSWTLKNYR